MSEVRPSEAPRGALVAAAPAGLAPRSPRSRTEWLNAEAARRWRRRALTRLQLFWLVHFGSQPHACNPKPMMVIAPHQDDEVLGCGGLIALKRRAGVPVQIVFVTDGAASHDALTVRDAQLVTLRRQEAVRAATILGVDEADVHFLDMPDGKLQVLDPDERQRTIDALRRLLANARPQELYVPHRHDRTDDHEETYKLAMTAVRAAGLRVDVYQYAVWLLWSALLFRDFKLEELKGASRLRIHAVRDQKRNALLAHRSQWAPRDGGAGPVLEPGFLRRFSLPDEVFFQADGSSPSTSDLRGC